MEHLKMIKVIVMFVLKKYWVIKKKVFSIIEGHPVEINKKFCDELSLTASLEI